MLTGKGQRLHKICLCLWIVMLTIQAAPVVQGDIAQRVRISRGCQTFGVGNAELRFREPAKPAQGTSLNDLAAEGELSGSKLLRRVGLKRIQGISGSILADQSFGPEDAKLVVPNRVRALCPLKTQGR